MLGGVIRAPVPPLGAVLEPGKLGWKRSVQQDDGLRPHGGCLWKQSPLLWGWHVGRGWALASPQPCSKKKITHGKSLPSTQPLGPTTLLLAGSIRGWLLPGRPCPPHPTPSHPATASGGELDALSGPLLCPPEPVAELHRLW